MAGEQKHHSQVEQFMLQARQAEGPALVALINQVLEEPGVYVFREFLQLPCIQELSKGPNDGYFKLLNMFAFGTYHDYKALKNTLPPLTEAHKNKLRHLTIVNLTAHMQVIPYSVLQKDLDVASVRELEDLLIEAVYANVLSGKLDQVRQQLEVDGCISRDLPMEGTAVITDILARWCSSCENICASIEEQVGRVSQCRENHLTDLQQIETEADNLCRKIQAASSPSGQDPDLLEEQDGGARLGSTSGAKQRRLFPAKTLSKTKSLPPHKH